MRRLAALAAGLALGAPGCAPSPAQTFPEGTAVAVEGSAISTEEVDAIAAQLAWLEPLDALDQRRRRALTNFLLPRAVAAARHGAARARALDRARRWLAHARGEAGELDFEPPAEEAHAGQWRDLGYFLFAAARELPLLEWHGPLEDVGFVDIVRVDARQSGERPIDDRLAVTLRRFAYLPEATTRAELEGWIDSARLEIVDPAWADVVPTYWKHRMRGGRP